MKDFYTAQEVADILKIKKTTVYDLIKKKTIPATKVGKQIRISKEDFDSYLTHSTENMIKDSEGRYDTKEEHGGIPLKSHLAEGQFMEPMPVKDTSDTIYMSRDFLRKNTGLILAGDEEIITAFYSYYRFEEDALPVIKQWGNLYDSLYSLYYGKVHAALIPVIEEEEKALYDIMLPGMNIVSLPIAYYDYGIYLNNKQGKQIHSLEELAASSCRFVISEKGSCERILFDKLVKSRQLDRKNFQFTEKECISTIQAAMMIQKGNADATFGSSQAKDQFIDLTFIPLQKVCLKLVYNSKYTSFPAFSAMEKVLQTDLFRRRMQSLGAYETKDLRQRMVF